MEGKITFSFGKNWQDFLKNLTDEKLKNAELSLKDFLQTNNLTDKSVLDIGCGSGIFSYALYRMNAKKVVSFDVDHFSVKCCKLMHEKAGNPKNWEVYENSILDDVFVSKLGTFDVVYSWGVLHHTGKMWESIKKSAQLVCKNGYYYIAIYNKVGGIFGSSFWLKVKKAYNIHPSIGYIIEMGSIISFIALELMKFRNPFKSIRDYQLNRGKSWRRDITDWIGGYPYECATIEEIFNFMKLNFPDFQLINIKSVNGLGNNSFLFHRKC